MTATSIFKTLTMTAAFAVAGATSAFAGAPAPGGSVGGNPTAQVCTASGECYTTIVLGGLPQQGDFQLLDTSDGLYTDAGPGDDGYRGGRWWVDVNGDGVQDDGDAYFICPLLGGGPDS